MGTGTVAGLDPCDVTFVKESAWTSCSSLCVHPCLCFCLHDPVLLETFYQRLVNCGEAVTASFYLRRAGSEQRCVLLRVGSESPVCRTWNEKIPFD